jgi:NAD(P)-dependent dehydrogenase (short-subunit alcohol dehydrogenase family)
MSLHFDDHKTAANVEYFKCDLTNADSLTVAADQIRAKWGDPTVLCCIAGVVGGKPLLGNFCHAVKQKPTI